MSDKLKNIEAILLEQIKTAEREDLEQWLIILSRLLSEVEFELIPDANALTEEEIQAAMLAVIKIAETPRGTSKKGRKPNRFRNLWQVFSLRVRGLFTTDQFIGKIGNVDHNHAIRTYISALNNALEEAGYGHIQLEHISAYKFVRRKRD